MTEQEWLLATSPIQMFGHVRGHPRLLDWVQACRDKWPEWAGRSDLNDPRALHRAIERWCSPDGMVDCADLADLMRDAIPYREVAIRNEWLTEHARRLIDEPAVLADALEEAGCDSEDLLMHLRGWGRCPGEDYSPFGSTCARCGGRGWLKIEHSSACWAMDLIRRAM